MINRSLNKGFTLFELVVVITISGLVFSIMAYFYVAFIKNKLYEEKRLTIFNQQMLTQEYLSKYIQNSLPITVGLSADQKCVQFNSVLGAGIFSSSAIAGEALFEKVFLDKNAEKNHKQVRYLSLLNKGVEVTDKLHAVFLTSNNTIETDIKISNSAGNAFLLLSDLNRFCLYDNQIRLYRNGNSSEYVPIAENVFSKQPFNLKKSSRNFFQLHIDLNFGDDVASLNSNFVITSTYEY